MDKNLHRLASYAVFRELYNNDNNIYDVIASFIKTIIVEKSLWKTNSQQMINILKDDYNFSLPEAVVKNVLRKRLDLSISEGAYHLNQEDFNKFKDEIPKKDTRSITNKIIEDLLQDVKNQKKEMDDEKVTNAFLEYLLDKKIDSDYSKIFSKYIIKNEKNKDFIQQLNLIKEGTILYSGISYTDEFNHLGSWKNKLTIFLDVEVLFDFAGYNGGLYQQLFNDFYNLVKQINSKEKIITLKYFEQTKTDIDKFFRSAESIIDGKNNANPSKTAMHKILENCKEKSDVVLKRNKFYQKLKMSGISEDTYENYFEEKNHKYNEDFSFLEGDNKNDKTAIDYLNRINILRKGEKRKLENAKYLFLTRHSNTLKYAWNDRIRENKSIPLATAIEFMTNHFWFRLGKGLGENSLPKSFSVLTQSKRILSAFVSDNISNQYKELKQTKLDDETIKNALAELKSNIKKPEEINESNIDDVMVIISQDSLEDTIKEQELFKQKSKETENENKVLKTDLEAEKLKNKELEEQIKEDAEKRQQLKNKRKKILNNILFIIFSLVIGFVIYKVVVYFFKSEEAAKILAIIASLLTIGYFLFDFYKVFL